MPDELEERASSARCRPMPPPGARRHASGRCGRRSRRCRRPPRRAGGAGGGCSCPPSPAPSPSCSAASRWPRPAAGCRWSAPPRTTTEPRARHPRAPIRPPCCPAARSRSRPRPAGRAWLATSAGAALHGRRLSALAVSPGAVWALEGSGRGLHAVGIPGGRPGFARRLPGTPVAAAWAPAGIRIAYVVRTPRRRPPVRHVRQRHARRSLSPPARRRPRRRAGAGTRRRSPTSAPTAAVMVHDVIDGATTPIPRGCGIRRAAAVAFAPYGGAARHRRPVGPRARRRHARATAAGCASTAAAPGLPKIAWLDPRQLVVGRGRRDHPLRRRPRGRRRRHAIVPGQVAGIAAAPGGRRIALALRDASGEVRVVEARTPRFSEASHAAAGLPRRCSTSGRGGRPGRPDLAVALRRGT